MADFNIEEAIDDDIDDARNDLYEAESNYFALCDKYPLVSLRPKGFYLEQGQLELAVDRARDKLAALVLKRRERKEQLQCA